MLKNIFNSEKVSAFKKMIEQSEKIILTCHMRPDGDAVGSTLGWYHLLRQMGKQALVLMPDRAPRSLEFLPGIREAGAYTNEKYQSFYIQSVKEADLIIMCDFNTATRQGNLADLIQEATCRKVLIDHHRDPDIACDIKFSFPESSSTCELVFRLMAACGWYGEMGLDCATCLLTGLITDTQNFSVNCDNPEVYEIMMRLLEKDVNKEEIIQEAVKGTSYNALRLNSFALLEKLELFEDSRCALITLPASDLKEFQYKKGDTEGLVNMPLAIRNVVYSVFMREDPDCIKVSCRSKYGFPVCDICRDLFNGGGHLMAAGGEYYGTLEDCRKILVEHMKDYDKYIPANIGKIER